MQRALSCPHGSAIDADPPGGADFFVPLGQILKLLCPDEKPEGAVKRLPSHAFPNEASAIAKQV